LAAAGGGFSDIFEDIFGEMMGGGRGRRSSGGRERGADLRYNMEITLEEAYTGKTAQIRVPTSITCDPAPDRAPSPAPSRRPATCGGSGRVRAAQGFFSIERTCPTCHGRGQTITDPCTKCAGQGRVTEERSLSVNIPEGIEDGTRIRLAGEGEAGMRGGPSGDLYIFLSVRPHSVFQREGADLFCTVPISMTTAALGGKFEITTMDGARSRVTVPEGTQPGKELRLARQGHAGSALDAVRGPLYPDHHRDAAEPVQAPARTVAGIPGTVLQGEQPRIGRLLLADEGLFRHHVGLIRLPIGLPNRSHVCCSSGGV
jgi:molecular chaperone DnaJ